MQPQDVYNALMQNHSPQFLPFRDAAFGPCSYNLLLIDCFKAIKKVI